MDGVTATVVSKDLRMSCVQAAACTLREGILERSEVFAQLTLPLMAHNVSRSAGQQQHDMGTDHDRKLFTVIAVRTDDRNPKMRLKNSSSASGSV